DETRSGGVRRDAARSFALYRDLTAGGFHSTPVGRKDLGYIGNVPLARFDGPPPELLKKLNLPKPVITHRVSHEQYPSVRRHAAPFLRGGAAGRSATGQPALGPLAFAPAGRRRARLARLERARIAGGLAPRRRGALQVRAGRRSGHEGELR